MNVNMILSTTIHDVKAVAISETKSLGHVVDRMSYYRVLKVLTEAGGGFELTLFSTDPDALSLIEDENLR